MSWALAWARSTVTGTTSGPRSPIPCDAVAPRRCSSEAGASRTESSQAGSGFFVGSTGDDFINLLDVSALLRHTHADNALTSLLGVFSTNFKDNPDGTRSNAQLGKLQVDLSHVRALPKGWSLLARFNGVLSLDPLVDLQRFRLGGPGSVRGFPSAELAGDQGFLLTLQASRRLLLGESFPPAVVRAFWDGGVVYRKKEARAVSGETLQESLTTLGAGFTVTFRKRYTLDVEGVIPTNSRRISDGREGGRIWAALAARF